MDLLEVEGGPGAPSAGAGSRLWYSSGQHQVTLDQDITAYIRLLRAEDFAGLQAPLPRMQEVPLKSFGTPEDGDIVVAVSHAWRNQAHPDPCGEKKEILRGCLEGIRASEPGRGVYVFLDFLSIPQQPFLAQQGQRTQAEEADFKSALGCMHKMFFLADRIIHLPWESQSSRVPGEGEECTVPASCLVGAEFMQTKDVVQVAQPPVGSEEVSLFDQVVRVDAECVDSVAMLEERLPAALSVTLRSYSFGLVNPIPTDERGWVFLERFITMVKCAMMDEAAASSAVITPCPSIRMQITEGSGRLRAAALREKTTPGALKQELCCFNAELQEKRFSAASIDKRQMMGSAGAEKDRAVVCGIMEEFVGHLADHWEAEALRQRGFAKRLAAMVAATEALFGEWDTFSPGYAARITHAADRSPWPLLSLLLAPLLFVLPLVLPMQHPDEPWERQTLFWGYMAPGMVVVEFSCVSGIIIKATGRAHYTRRVAVRVMAMGAAFGYLFVGLGLALATVLDVFPVPYLGMMVAASIAFAAPLSYFCIEPGERGSPNFRQRFIVSSLGAVGVVVICAMPLLLLLAFLEVVSLAWQVLLILGFFLVKVSFEVLSTKLAKTLGGDAIPIFLLCAVSVYQAGLCFAFTRVSHWLIALETISLDALENVYYCCSLRQKATSLSAEQKQYLITSLALREFLELLLPLQVTLVFFILLHTNREGFSVFCKEDPFKGITYLVLDLAVELTISCLTCCSLRRDGHAPLRALKAFLLHENSSFFIICGPIVMAYFTFHGSHWGVDFGAKLLWLREGYQWSCGQAWIAVL